MENYELAVQNVKATLFDRVYREQGLVDIINKKLDGYSPEVQERLSTLFTKQKENIDSVLSLLDEFEIKMGDILAQSEEIITITKGNTNVSEEKKVDESTEEVNVSEQVSPVVDEVAAVSEGVLVENVESKSLEEPQNVQESVVSENPTVETTTDQVVVSDASESVASNDGVVNNEVVVPIAEQEVQVSTEQVEVPNTTETVSSDSPVVLPSVEQNVVEVPTTDAVPAVVMPAVEVSNTDNSAASESAVSEASAAVENVSDNNTEVVSTPVEQVNSDNASVIDVETNTSEQAISEAVAPVAEVVQIPGQTNALEDDAPVATGEFVLSPIDEGVAMSAAEAGIAVADNQLQAIENVKNEIAADLNLTTEEKDVALEKYTRMTAGTVKAILVTKSQYEKLLSSRETQKALLNAKNNNAAVEAVTDTTESVSVPTVESPQVETASVAPLAPIPETTADVAIAPVADSTPVVNVEASATAPVQVNEQTLIANGLLAPTVQDKQKEMQAMIAQANELYKSGKTQEAQDLFNKVSVMNKELQAGAQGQTLVKS